MFKTRRETPLNDFVRGLTGATAAHTRTRATALGVRRARYKRRHVRLRGPGKTYYAFRDRSRSILTRGARLSSLVPRPELIRDFYFTLLSGSLDFFRNVRNARFSATVRV